LSVVQEVVNDSKGHVEAVAMLGTIQRPITRQNIDELANVAAHNTVDGFIAQDRLDFDGAVLHWSQVFHTMCPDLDSERVVKAAEAFTTALFAESKLKDDITDPYLRVHDEKWQYVRDQLVRMCHFLEFPSSFGIETCDSYRYHAVSDDAYLKHTLESHRVLVKRLTGSERAYRVLAGLYVSATALHDLHNKYAIKKGVELMKFYYTILFDAKYGVPPIED
jgi:hypothetical protein